MYDCWSRKAWSLPFPSNSLCILMLLSIFAWWYLLYIGAAFDDIETALSKFTDGPFFLGQFSLVSYCCAIILLASFVHVKVKIFSGENIYPCVVYSMWSPCEVENTTRNILETWLCICSVSFYSARRVSKFWCYEQRREYELLCFHYI